MRTFDEMVNGPKQETRTFSDMAKSTYQGKGKRVGTKGNYRYIYDDDKKSKPSNKKEGMFSKLFGGMKKLFGKKPTPSSREKLEKLATDKGMLSSIAKLTDLKALLGLRDMLLAHGAEEKKPRAAAEPSEPVESEDNFETMPEADPEPKERKERKTNPLNKLLALVNKRIGQLEAEKPEKKDEPKSEDNFDTMPESEKGDPFEHGVDFKVMYGPTIKLSTNERIALSLVLHRKSAYRRDEARKVGMDEELYDKTIEELKTKGVLGKNGGLQRIRGMTAQRAYEHVKNQGVTVEPWDMKGKGIRAYIEPKSEDNFDTMPEKKDENVGRTWESEKGQRTVVAVKTVGGKEVAMVSRPGLSGFEMIALQDLDKEIAFEQKQAASSKKMKEIATAAKVKEQEAQADLENFQGYEDTLSAKMRARMFAALNKIGLFDGERKTQKQAIQDLIAQGYLVKESKTFGRILENPQTGSFYAQKDLSKFGIDYAEHLINKPKAEENFDTMPESDAQASVQRMQETNDRKAAVGLGRSAGSSELEAREKAIAEGKASMVDGKYVEKPKSPAAQALEFVESNKPENRTKTAKDTVMRFLTEKRRNQSAMVGLLGANDDGGGYSLQLKQAKTGTLTAIVTRPDGSQSAKKLPKAISATAPQDIHKIALEHHADVSAKDQKRIKARQDRLDTAAKAVADLPPAPLTASFNPDTVAMKSSEKHGKEALNTDSHKYLSEYVSKDTSRTAIAHVRHAQGVSVATDGHRLVIVPTDRTTEEAILVPGKGIKAQYDKTTRPDVKKEIEGYQGHSAYFEETRISFPDYSRVIPQGGTPTTVSAEHIAKIADLAQAHSAKDDSRLGRVVLETDGEGGVFARVERNPTVMESRDEDYPGKEPIKVGTYDDSRGRVSLHVNARFLKASLKGVKKGDSVQMTLNGGLDPLMIDHESGIKHLVMPLRP